MEISKKVKIVNGKNIYSIFPYINDINKKANLKIDNDSVNYISSRKAANNISKIIKNHLENLGIFNKKNNDSTIIITDAFAGVGGNTISFSQFFGHVNAIELETNRYSYLINNCNIYELNNIDFYQMDCTKLIHTLRHNVIFFDPPWGGKDYKKEDTLRIKINDIPQEDIINDLLNPQKNICCPDLIVLKLPKNYDLKYLHNKIINKNIYIEELQKMIIIIIYNNKTIK